MISLKSIIFDMDGTLADTEELHRRAFNLAFREHACPLNWSRLEYKRLLSISGGRERIHHCLQQAGMAALNCSRPWTPYIRQSPPCTGRYWCPTS